MISSLQTVAAPSLPLRQQEGFRSITEPLNGLTTPERVRDVVENPDHVVRNLQITQSYHEFTLAFDEFLGHRDGAWCMFATWVSKQVGYFIRNEEVPKPLRQFLGLDVQPGRLSLSPLRRLLLNKPLLRYIRFTVEDVSHYLGEGNRLVYANLGTWFANFLMFLRSHQGPDPMKLDAFLNQLSKDPVNGEEIARAFTHFYHAVYETNPQIKAERMFMTNMLIGLHEQVRLQGPLDNTFQAPIRRALDDPQRHLIPLPLPGLLRRAGATLTKRLASPLIERLEQVLQRVVTACLLTIATPTERLDADQDMPPLPNGEMYPEALKRLTLSEAHDLVEELDYTPHTTRGSGARDWRQLGDRMNYVVDLFRSRQQERILLQAPFSPVQTDAIRAGRLPAGPL
ncbi:hypothetical protein [Candidatus Entotheonella palauensis]|uniref:hypothetical protein n=1 Tax=Candidatus Entotheonella palauensis TaxID=93172 RepID=UPI000B7EEC1B|nr:hypothetical protein [Candidatus Entotheonella palauensis]